MRRTRAQDVLPAKLLAQIQQYVQGCTLYIPKEAEKRKAWGEGTGSRGALTERNARICAQYASGVRVEALAQEFHLTQDSVKKIIRRQKSGPA